MHAFLPFSIELAAIAQYGYLAFALLLFIGEIVGFIPLGLLLVAMGAFAHQRLFSLPLLFLIALIASVVGNFALYTIAAKLGKKDFYQRRVKDTALASRIEAHMKKHPGLTVFATRFIGFAAYPTTLIAGLVRVPRHIFIPAVALGNGICCLAYLLVGYLVGGAWAHDAKITSIAISSAFAVGALGYLLVKFLRSRPTVSATM